MFEARINPNTIRKVVVVGLGLTAFAASGCLTNPSIGADAANPVALTDSADKSQYDENNIPINPLVLVDTACKIAKCSKAIISDDSKQLAQKMKQDGDVLGVTSYNLKTGAPSGIYLLNHNNYTQFVINHSGKGDLFEGLSDHDGVTDKLEFYSKLHEDLHYGLSGSRRLDHAQLEGLGISDSLMKTGIDMGKVTKAITHGFKLNLPEIDSDATSDNGSMEEIVNWWLTDSIAKTTEAEIIASRVDSKGFYPYPLHKQIFNMLNKINPDKGKNSFFMDVFLAKENGDYPALKRAIISRAKKLDVVMGAPDDIINAFANAIISSSFAADPNADLDAKLKELGIGIAPDTGFLDQKEIDLAMAVLTPEAAKKYIYQRRPLPDGLKI